MHSLETQGFFKADPSRFRVLNKAKVANEKDPSLINTLDYDSL